MRSSLAASEVISGKQMEQRVALLSTYNILDTLEEQEYDELTRLASVICETPISLISLIDRERQWFKSRHGINVQETPVELSFCVHAIGSGLPLMMVENASTDERFRNNSLVTDEPSIGFYAGVPLIGEDKIALGTLCVIDHHSRTLTSVQQDALQILARQVMDKLELRRKVSTMKESEQRLNLLNEQLSIAERAQFHLVEQRTNELQEANTSLKRSNEDLLQFAHVSSHDLREPLRKIKYFNGQLTNEEMDALSPRGKDALKKIDKSVNRVLQIVDAVLRYSRDLSADADHAEVNLDEVLANVREDLSHRLSGPGIQITSQKLGTVNGSATQIYQLFLNLTSNALKFAHNARPLELSISCSHVNVGGHFFKQIVFSDNGIGFSGEHASAIFTAFTRLHSKDMYEGTGIGLSLCQKIVQRHGGTITASGLPDAGATFHILLPAPHH